MTTNQTLVFTDGAQTYYLLKRANHYHGDAQLHAEAGPLAYVRDGIAYATGWWRADGPPSEVTITWPGRQVKVGYELRNPAAESAAYPLRVAAGAEAEAMRLDDDTMTALYNVLYEPGPVETETIPVADMTIVDDRNIEPVPQDGLVWVANVIDELGRHPELHHLFPGHLIGFRKAVVAAIERLPFLRGRGMFDAGVYEKDGYVNAHATTAYEPHHTRFVRSVGRNGQPLKRGRDVTETKTLRVSFPVPSAIAGATRAEAVQRWHEALAVIVEDVTQALTAAPCWHCSGTGIVSAKSAAKAGV